MSLTFIQINCSIFAPGLCLCIFSVGPIEFMWFVCNTGSSCVRRSIQRVWMFTFEDQMAVSGKRQRNAHFSIKFKPSVRWVCVCVCGDVNGAETYIPNDEIAGICVGARTHTARFAAYENSLIWSHGEQRECATVWGCVRATQLIYQLHSRNNKIVITSEERRRRRRRRRRQWWRWRRTRQAHQWEISMVQNEFRPSATFFFRVLCHLNGETVYIST